MAKRSSKSARVQFGDYLKNHREKVLGENNLLVFSYSSKLDNSKLRKIEKGEVDIQFDTLIEIAKTYQLSNETLFGLKLILDE